MLRDDVVRALEAQPWNMEVRLKVGHILVDVARIDHDSEREAIVLELQPDDLGAALEAAVNGPWWRGTPGAHAGDTA